MDKSFGFNLNTSMVIDKDGKASCGVSYKDSDGYNFRKDKKGDDASSVVTDLINDFVGGYTEHLISAKATEKAKKAEAPASEKAEKAQPQVSDDLTRRLRELEEENRRLKAEKAAAESKAGTRKVQTSVPVTVSEKPESKSASKPKAATDARTSLDIDFSETLKLLNSIFDDSPFFRI